MPWLALAALASLARASDEVSADWLADGSPTAPVADYAEPVMDGGGPMAYGSPHYVAQYANPGEPLGFSGARFAPQPGFPIDPGASPGVFEAPYTVMEEPLDPFGPAPATSSGEWLRNGYWYTEQSVVYYDRLAAPSNRTRLAFEFLPTGNINENTLEAQIGMGYQPGLRSTLGRYLGRDVHNRDHAVEFTFLGLLHWQYSETITAVNAGTIFQSLDPFVIVPVFDGSDVQGLNHNSDFNSFEFNYKIDYRLGRDRLVYSRDSCWIREGTPSLLCSLFAGVRALTVNENLRWLATSSLGSGSYNVVTHNNLVGPQAGADLFYEHVYWRAGVRATTGALVNWASQSSTVRILDQNGQPLSPNRDEYAKDHTLSFAGGLHFIGEYRFRPTFGLRVAYDLNWVSDLALAQNQLTFLPSTPPGISQSHSLFFHGVSLGFEWFR